MIAYGFITGLGGGIAYVTPIATLIRWFPDKRGLLTGLAVMGYGLGAFILGNIGPYLILRYGVASTFCLWGGLSLIVVTAASLTLINTPEGWNPGHAEPASMKAAVLTVSSTFSEAICTPRFWTCG
jgi:OFA family oxalate/formate antiporter-like MFS transporter